MSSRREWGEFRVDDTPTQNSKNPVESGGVFTELTKKIGWNDASSYAGGNTNRYFNLAELSSETIQNNINNVWRVLVSTDSVMETAYLRLKVRLNGSGSQPIGELHVSPIGPWSGAVSFTLRLQGTTGNVNVSIWVHHEGSYRSTVISDLGGGSFNLTSSSKQDWTYTSYSNNGSAVIPTDAETQIINAVVEVENKPLPANILNAYGPSTERLTNSDVSNGYKDFTNVLYYGRYPNLQNFTFMTCDALVVVTLNDFRGVIGVTSVPVTGFTFEVYAGNESNPTKIFIRSVTKTDLNDTDDRGVAIQDLPSGVTPVWNCTLLGSALIDVCDRITVRVKWKNPGFGTAGNMIKGFFSVAVMNPSGMTEWPQDE